MMASSTTIGIVTVGQSPRIDLEEDFRKFLPRATLRITGALDGLSNSDLDALALSATGDYPIRCRLSDGSDLAVGKQEIERRLQVRIDELEKQGARVIVVGCTSVFSTLRSSVPLVAAGKLANRVAVDCVTEGKLGCIVPLSGQVETVASELASQGVPARVVSASPTDSESRVTATALELEQDGCSLIYLRCFGFNLAWQRRVQASVRVPVLAPVSITAAVTLSLALDAG